MTARSTATDLTSAAEDALRHVLSQLGLQPAPAPPGQGADLLIVLPGGERRMVEAKAAAVPTKDWVTTLSRRHQGDRLVVVVGDQISADVREALNARDIGWFDRRGHLRLTDAGLYVEVDVPPLPRGRTDAGAARQPVRGRAGRAAAAALLMRPDDPISASEAARVAHLNPSSVTRALKSFVDANLAERRDGGKYRPLVPELFWALAEVWPRERANLHVAVGDLGQPGFGVNAGRVGEPGWSLCGEVGAVGWGAPLVLTADYPLFFYVPDDRALRTAKALADKLGEQGSRVDIAIDPVGLVTHARYRRPRIVHPLGHPLFCALDLTATSRDREALDQWVPQEGFARVW
jgi:hypothetical protein